MNKKKVILLSIVVVLLVIVFLLFIVFKHKKIETEGDYTGYQLILTAKYEGYGVAGQNLGEGTEKKIFNISENDTFYEPLDGGIWLLNPQNAKIQDSDFFNYEMILKVIELGEDQIKVENNDVIHNIKYNEELNISSNFTIYDGINYKYTIKVIKK